MSLFLRPIHLDGKQDPFRGFDLNCFTFDMVAGAHLATDFRVPICDIPFEALGIDHRWASDGDDTNVLGKEAGSYRRGDPVGTFLEKKTDALWVYEEDLTVGKHRLVTDGVKVM